MGVIHLNVQMADAYGADGAVMEIKIVKMVVMKLSSHVVSMLSVYRSFSYSTKESGLNCKIFRFYMARIALPLCAI